MGAAAGSRRGRREPGERTKEDEEHGLLMENVIVRDSGTAETVQREHIETNLGAKAMWRLMTAHG